MSIAEKLTQIAENEQKVYEAGQKSEYDRFWDAFQYNGTRTDYINAFYRWGNDYIRPKYKVVPTSGSANNTFYRCPNLLVIEKEFFDFSMVKEANYMCSESPSLSIFEDVGLGALSKYTYTWFYCSNLKTIEVMRCVETSTFNKVFVNCSELENLTIDGTIGQDGFNVSWSTKLTHDSLMSIINALADKSGDTSGTNWVVTIGSENYAKLTEAEIEIAVNKGWSIA